MPNTKLTRARLNNHFHYSKLIYVIIIALAWFGSDLLFTVTEYRPPNERKVDIYLVGSSVNAENCEPFAQVALAAGQEADPTLEAVSFFPLLYDPADTSDAYGVQKYMVMLGAQEGDIFFVNRDLMAQLVEMQAVLPLDDYIASGVLDPGERDLSRVTFYEPAVEEGAAPSGDTHVYALQAEPLNRLLEQDINYYNMDKYMVIMSYSANPDTTAVVMQSLIDQLTAPIPQWVQDAWDARAAEANATPAPSEEPAP